MVLVNRLRHIRTGWTELKGNRRYSFIVVAIENIFMQVL